MSETCVKSIKGFKDILPRQAPVWRFVETSAAEVFSLYGFSRIMTPVMEFTDLYARGIGGSTDIVEKEMYSFEDRDGSSITLRPEGTAGVVRAFIENSLHKSAPVHKLYYSGEMFRHERPQKGRMREFHQMGAEFFGSSSPSSDCETIAMLWHFFRRVGLTEKVALEINSMGTPEERTDFKSALGGFLKGVCHRLCEDCVRRVKSNPLRVLDCKDKQCSSATAGAPLILEFLGARSTEHFEEVKETLGSLSVPFKVNERIVRGLDYYTRTVFEVKAEEGGLGAQNAVAAGGRYDLLVEMLGGPPTPAVGFAIGVERVVVLLEEDKAPEGGSVQVFAGWIGGDCFGDSFALCSGLRERGVSVWIEHSESGIKSQIKKADKMNAGYMAIIGPDEMSRGVVKLRNMKTGDEKEFPRDRAEEGIRGEVKSVAN